MKIYTKKGDGGQTGLIGGTKVLKSHLRIEAYGTLDEMNAHIGLLRDQSINEVYIQQLLIIQDRLFTMGSCLAADPEHSTMKLPEINAEDIVVLEDWMDQMEEVLPEMKHFILPGGHPIVSICHIARCVCRRAERNVVTLAQNSVVDPLILSYMNRLSDYLFVLGRKLGQDIGIVEVKWIPKH